jgi:hypothetical protein
MIFTEQHAIKELHMMNLGGCPVEDIEQFIDVHFHWNENTCQAYLRTEEGEEVVRNPVLISVIELANDIYTDDQIRLMISFLE